MEKRRSVSFSANATLRKLQAADTHQAYSSWLTEYELLSLKKRAQNLSKIHYFKTRPGRSKALTKRSGIVYKTHPAHYEIIGESLRGMDHITDVLKGRRRERMHFDAIRLVQEHQIEADPGVRSKLASKYREITTEAMVYARTMAEEDAKAAAEILEEDLKEDDGIAAASAVLPPLPLASVLPPAAPPIPAIDPRPSFAVDYSWLLELRMQQYWQKP